MGLILYSLYLQCNGCKEHCYIKGANLSVPKVLLMIYCISHSHHVFPPNVDDTADAGLLTPLLTQVHHTAYAQDTALTKVIYSLHST